MPSDSLAEFELLVMLAAIRLGPSKAYTVPIAEEIRRRTGRSVRRASVFTALQRLEKKGMVFTRLGEPRPDRGGRPPRLVSVQPAGFEAVQASVKAVKSMARGLGNAIGKV